MKKLSTFTLIILLSGISQHTYAKTVHFDSITGFAKITDMYKRADSVKQPKFITFEKGVDLLKQVNRYSHKKITYPTEAQGVDYWQSPKETIESGKGDCEDYAIVKWQALLDNGIPESDMYFMEGKHKLLNEMHVVLMVMIDGKFYYLDNTSESITQSMISEETSFTINRKGFNVYMRDLPDARAR